jgi:hypothetical protein
MSHLSRLPGLALLFLLLALCHVPGALARTHACEMRAARTHLSIRVRDLQSWEPVDERTLLVWASDATRAHLLHLSRPVEALISTPILTLVDGDRDGHICACGHDGVQVGNGVRARIRSIEYLSEKRTVELDRHGWSVPLEAAGKMPVHRRLGRETFS